ncbi:MAG: acetamidase/formamidase family protein [Desulfurococcaceae archaeon]
MKSSVIVPSDKVYYVFSPEVPPTARVEVDTSVVIYTQDALGGQITSEEHTISSVDFSRVNPATGPIYIEGADTGDALLIRVKSVNVAEKGFIATAPGAGALSHLVKKAKTRTCYVKGDVVEFLNLRLPTRKMIGVIGVATSERTSTGVPGRHGGNLDTRFITQGASVILPVEYPGAFLGVGDLHAAMGDGEVCVAACEVSGSVELEFSVIKGLAPLWPIVDYDNSLYILVSRENVSVALEEAISVAVEALSRSLKLEWHDAYMLASLTVDIGISQLVDPRKTVWARIPKSLLTFEKLLRGLSFMREHTNN